LTFKFLAPPKGICGLFYYIITPKKNLRNRSRKYALALSRLYYTGISATQLPGIR